MPITVEWDNPEKTIIRYTFSSQWSVEEFFDAYPVADRMMQASATRVIGILVDDSAELIPPKGAMNAFKQTVRRGTLPIVFVGANLASKTMMETLQKAYKGTRQLFYVETLEEARRIFAALAANNADES
jgi:hypothetical protein